MSYKQIRLLVLSIFIAIGFIALTSTTSAQSSVSMSITNLSLVSCSNIDYLVQFDVTHKINTANGDYIRQITTRPDGTSNSRASALTFQPSPQNDWQVGYAFANTAFPYTTTWSYSIRNSGQNFGTITIEVQCTATDTGYARIIFDSFNGLGGPPDDRMNWQRGDYNAVAYLRKDGENKDQIELYCWDEETEIATLAFVVTQTEIDALGIPSENTLIASAPDCHTEFYILTTGETQLNITSSDELHVLISPDGVNFFGARYQVTKFG